VLLRCVCLFVCLQVRTLDLHNLNRQVNPQSLEVHTHARTHARVHARTHARVHARAHTRARTHTRRGAVAVLLSLSWCGGTGQHVAEQEELANRIEEVRRLYACTVARWVDHS
jgi:hypothetical protein